MTGERVVISVRHISEIITKRFERRDKTYLRNELNQTYHYMKIYTFIIRLLCVTINTNFDVCKETQKERTYTLDGLINEERLISSLANGWAYIRGGEALKWGFTVHVLIACRQALNSLELPKSGEGKGERKLALTSQNLHIRVPEWDAKY